MPSLKQLLDSAIKNGGMFGTPNETAGINITSITENEWGQTYTAPEDGFLFICAYEPYNLFLGTNIGLPSYVQGVAAPEEHLQYGSCLLPVRKGLSYTVFYYKKAGQNYHIGFFPLRGKS